MYKNYDEIYKTVYSNECDEYTRETLKEQIINSYFFISVCDIGKSVLNRPIECFRIGNKPDTVFMCGGVHGMEWITSSLLYLFIINIGDAIINQKSYFNQKILECLSKKSIAIVPCANPDGVEISIHGSNSAKHFREFVESISQGSTDDWQSNAYGVDINHNFNAGWKQVKKMELSFGIESPGKTRYGGTAPENQPETIALTKFCRTTKLHTAIAFHSQGEEIYWNYGNNTPPESIDMAKNMSVLSGYNISSPEGIATGGGFKDWVIDELKVPAFTIEIGKGINPLDISQLIPIYSKIEDMLLYMCQM